MAFLPGDSRLSLPETPASESQYELMDEERTLRKIALLM
jgi:hypothetical protein